MKRRNFLAALAAVVPALLPTRTKAAFGPRSAPTALPNPRVDRALNARDFGAVGDGITDDTAAIKNAITVAESGDRKTVILPTGVYLVQKAIEVPGGVILAGEGQSGTVILSNASEPVIHIKRNKVWRGGSIQNLTVQGNAGAGESQIGILVDEGPHLYGTNVRDVRIEDCGGPGLKVGRAFSSNFENIFITNCGDHPFYMADNAMPGNIYRNIHVQVCFTDGQGWRISRKSTRSLA
jgi:hypothetical protein